MALTWASNVRPSSGGFRLLGHKDGIGSLIKTERVPATAAETFTKGQPLKISAGRVTGAGDGDTIWAISAEAKTIPAYTSSSDDHMLAVWRSRDYVFKAPLYDLIEADVSPTAVSSNGTVLAFGSGLSNDTGDDIHNGSVIFCYDGPGKGEWRIITDYDSAGHATGDQACVLNRPFKTLPTTDSVFGILGTATNGSNIAIGSNLDLDDNDGTYVAGDDITGATITIVGLEHLKDGFVTVRLTGLP